MYRFIYNNSISITASPPAPVASSVKSSSLVLGEGSLEVLDVLDGLEDDVELAEAEAGEAGRQQAAQLVQLRSRDRLRGELLQLGEVHVVNHPAAASCQT